MSNPSQNDNNIEIVTTETTAFRLWIALILSILFLAFSSKFAYRISNEVSRTLGFPRTCTQSGASTGFGIISHTVAFFILLLLLI